MSVHSQTLTALVLHQQQKPMLVPLPLNNILGRIGFF